MSPNNSLTIACGDAVVVAAARNVAAVDDVVATIGVVAMAALVVWVQR